MYNNIGRKLKTLAKVVAILGIIASVIYGIVLIVQGGKLSSYSSYLGTSGTAVVRAGFTVMIFGSLGSWISSWALYAIGDTNEKITEMYKGTSNNTTIKCPSEPDVKKCANCGSVVGSDKKYCRNCGAVLGENIENPAAKENYGNCEMCDNKNVEIHSVKIVDNFGTRYRKVCNDCLKVYNCQPTDRNDG